MPAGRNAPSDWPGGAVQRDVDGVRGQHVGAEGLGDDVAEHGADGAVRVDDVHGDLHRGAVAQRFGGHGDQALVEVLVQLVVLAGEVAQRRVVVELEAVQDRIQVQPFGLPVVDRLAGVEHLGVADRLLDAAETQLGEDFADFLGEEFEEVHHELGLAVEAGAQLGVLGRDAHRAGVQVADAHHDAAGDHQRGGGETELLAAEQRGDHDVAAGLELAVHLHHHAVAQAVEHERLLGLGEAELPRDTGVLERVQRRGAGTAVVPGNQHDVGLRLGDAGGHGADPDLGDELDVHPGRGVGALGVVDQLREVLDRVDVVVRGRGDESDAGRRVPRAGHPGVDLLRHQLAAFAGLGTLRHLDLDVVRVGQVQAGDAEAAGGDLLDRGTAGRDRAGGPRPRRLHRCWTCRPAGSWRSRGSRGLPWRWSRSSWRRWRTA